jgi:hypothetical protein
MQDRQPPPTLLQLPRRLRQIAGKAQTPTFTSPCLTPSDLLTSLPLF